MSRFENPAHPDTVARAWDLLASRLESLIPEGYLLRPGGRVVRTDPDLPDFLELPTERGGTVQIPAPLTSEMQATVRAPA